MAGWLDYDRDLDLYLVSDSKGTRYLSQHPASKLRPLRILFTPS